MATLAHARCNQQFLPSIPFPAGLTVRDDLSGLTADVRSFLLAVPSHAFCSLLQALRPQLHPDATVAWATKGMDPASGRLLSQVADDVLGTQHASGIISGPTFALEVARGLPTAVTVASARRDVAQDIAQWLRNDRVRVYTSVDRVGVELGGAVKNVMAIATGISDGLGFGANARAALITRGLAEMRRLGDAMGARAETFMGLAGLGDLVLTCTDNQSRNRRVGLALGQGHTLARALADLGQVAEGVATAREVYALARRLAVDMPITEQVYRVLYENLSPQSAVEALLRREPRAE
jgi:glycerol-3-phosphate dehydrogenase (NAD(P)+)